MEKEESNEDHEQSNNFFCLLKCPNAGGSELTAVKGNLSSDNIKKIQEIFIQRLEKGLVHTNVGTVISVELEPEAGCYYYAFANDVKQESCKFLLCFISQNDTVLDFFRADLDTHSKNIIQTFLKHPNDEALPDMLVSSLENWYSIAVEYIVRCKQAMRDSLKYLIHAAMLDKKLILSGGTAELQTDIQRFYDACSLSDILSQLRESRAKQEGGSLSGSVDMLVDLDSTQTDTQPALTVSITVDSVKLDSNGCNRYCEEWANRLSHPDVQNNPVRLKQITEAFKLKFIQTMNTLKRLLQEAENDFYALYRSYVFLRDSGNSEILLHYVTTEAAAGTTSVLRAIQEFMREKHAL